MKNMFYFLRNYYVSAWGNNKILENKFNKFYYWMNNKWNYPVMEYILYIFCIVKNVNIL